MGLKSASPKRVKSIVDDVHSLAGWHYPSYRVLLAPLTYFHVGKTTEESPSNYAGYTVEVRSVLTADLLRTGTSHSTSCSV